jgi:hypothetical protein
VVVPSTEEHVWTNTSRRHPGGKMAQTRALEMTERSGVPSPISLRFTDLSQVGQSAYRFSLPRRKKQTARTSRYRCSRVAAAGREPSGESLSGIHRTAPVVAGLRPSHGPLDRRSPLHAPGINHQSRSVWPPDPGCRPRSDSNLPPLATQI